MDDKEHTPQDTTPNSSSNDTPTDRQKITRKDALKKAGKYAIFTASSMIYLLSSQEARGQSPEEPQPPGQPGFG